MLLSAVESAAQKSLSLQIILDHLVFSFSIGYTCFFVISIIPVRKIQNRWLRTLALAGLFACSGLIGSALAMAILAILAGQQIRVTGIVGLITSAVFLSLIFSAAGYSYFHLRESFRQTAAKLAEKEIAQQKLLQLKIKAELDALRAKINPHFLFNTLNSIASLIPFEPEKAEEMVQKLAHLFRYSLETNSDSTSTLQKEIDIVLDYLAIEKIRLGNRLNFEVKMDETLADMELPSLLLQPLVENSVIHAIGPRKNGGYLQISCEHVKNNCVIRISDNGGGFTKTPKKTGFGLQSVRERLALAYGSDYDLSVINHNGVSIRIQLPLSTEAWGKGQNLL